MNRTVRLLVLLTAMVSLGATLSSTAGAVTWENAGDTAFTATSGAWTLSSTSAGLACPNSTMTGTVGTSPFSGLTWNALHGTLVWTGCTLGVSGYSLHCTYTFTASGKTGSTATGAADLTCGVSLSGSKFCHLEGSVSASYTDPGFGLPGSLALGTGGTVVATPAFIPVTCPLGENDLGHWRAMTLTVVSGSGGPILRRTA